MKNEQYKKLKQLDRIEYTLLLNELKKKYSLVSINIIWLNFIIGCLFTILALTYYIAFKNTLIFNIAFYVSKVLFYAFIFGIILDVYQILRFKTLKGRLDKHFLK